MRRLYQKITASGRFLGRMPRRAVSTGRFVRTVAREFQHDHGPLMAAAMSFYATLSLFPTLLLGISALGYVIGSQKAFVEVMGFFQQYVPGAVAGTVRDTLQTIVATRTRILTLGLVGLLWTATNLFVNMEAALCITWDVKKRPFWKSRLLALGMLLVVGAGLLLSLAFTALTLRIEGLHWTILGYPLPELPAVWRVLGFAMPILIGILTFTVIYLALPNTRTHLRACLLGGTVSGLLWQVALQGFRWFLRRYAHFDVVYGSLGSVIILVLWIYYSMNVLLIGAQVAWEADQRLRAAEGRPSETPEEKLASPAELP